MGWDGNGVLSSCTGLNWKVKKSNERILEVPVTSA
jgi:hypothetical protein